MIFPSESDLLYADNLNTETKTFSVKCRAPCFDDNIVYLLDAPPKNWNISVEHIMEWIHLDPFNLDVVEETGLR